MPMHPKGEDLYCVTRIVLINSGKYIYGDFKRLDSPAIVLAGDNNYGKTTVINSLQYLYIDDQSKMSFGNRSREATRRYYFPDHRKSYIIFECRTQHGFRTVIIACPTPNRDLQRWVYEGSFRKQYFIGGDDPETYEQVRDFQDVKAILADRNVREVKPSEHARCLIGKTAGTDIPSLGIVPVADEDGYKRFREIFTNLLHLKDIDELSLRKLLLKVYRGEFIGPELNVRQEYGEWLRETQRRTNRVRSLSRLTPNIKKLIESYTYIRQLHGRIPALWQAFVEKHKSALAHAQAALDECDEKKQETLARRQRLYYEQERINKSLPKIIQDRANIESTINRRDLLLQKLQGYNEADNAHELASAEQELDDINYRFRLLKNYTLEELQEKERILTKKIDELDKAISHHDSTVCSQLVRLTDSSAVTRAFTVLSKDILSKVADNIQVSLRAPEEAVRVVESVASIVAEDGGINLEWLSIAPGVLDSPLLDQYLDTKSLSRQKAEKLRELNEVKSLIGLSVKRDEYSERIDTLKRIISSLRENQLLAKQLAELEVEVNDQIERRAELLAEEQEMTQRQSALLAEISALQHELDDITQQYNQRLAAVEALNRRKSEIDQLISPIRAQMLDWNPDSSDLDVDVGEHILAGQLKEQLAKYTQGLQQIQSYRNQLLDDPDGMDILTAAKPSMELEHLLETLNTIEDQREDAQRTWEQGVNSLTNRLNGILSGLDTMKQRVTNINLALTKMKVSDLREIKIEMSEHTSKKNRLQNVIDHKQTPLLTDKKQTEEAMSWLETFIRESELLSVLDLFNLEFHVEQADGTKVVYTSLDEETESTGTVITIKVLINILLMRGLLGKSALRKSSLYFYLDEAGRLGPRNLKQITRLARENGLGPILAAPTPVQLPWALHIFIQAIPNDGRPGGGRVIVDEFSYHDVKKKTDSEDKDFDDPRDNKE